MSNYMKPKERKAQILAEAAKQAARDGYNNIERQKIADALQISPALVSARCGTMADLKRDVMRFAVQHRVLAVIAQGIALRDRRALRLPEELKAAAVQSLQQ